MIKKQLQRKMKVNRIIYVSLLVVLCLTMMTGCKYDPPEGYTESHQSFHALTNYAEEIDPNAKVKNEPELIKDDYWEYKVYPATINGIECHVASVSDTVYDSTGEFGKRYYKPDTDYDFYVVQEILKDYPDLGTFEDDSESERFQINDILYTVVKFDDMTEEKVEKLFNDYVAVNSAMEQYPLHKIYYLDIYVGENKYRFTVPESDEKDKVIRTMKADGVLEFE